MITLFLASKALRVLLWQHFSYLWGAMCYYDNTSLRWEVLCVAMTTLLFPVRYYVLLWQHFSYLWDAMCYYDNTSLRWEMLCVTMTTLLLDERWYVLLWQHFSYLWGTMCYYDNTSLTCEMLCVTMTTLLLDERCYVLLWQHSSLPERSWERWQWHYLILSPRWRSRLWWELVRPEPPRRAPSRPLSPGCSPRPYKLLIRSCSWSAPCTAALC